MMTSQSTSSGKGFRLLELVSNAAIVLLAVTTCYVLVTRFVLRPDTATNYDIGKGTRLSVRGIDWTQADRTLVLALDKNCEFCKESVPFYQKLSALRSGTALVVAMPEQHSTIEEYLKRNAIPIRRMAPVPFTDLHVAGTPTLLLMDSKGTILNAWIGKLNEKQESEVIRSLM